MSASGLSAVRNGMSDAQELSDSWLSGDSRPKGGCEALADIVDSREVSVGGPRGGSRKLASNELVAAVAVVVVPLGANQLLSVGKSLDKASGSVAAKAVVARSAAFNLAVSSRLMSTLLPALLLGIAWVSEASCLRPAHLLAKYSQVIFRLTQREHAGFSLGHRTLDDAQPMQQSRSLGVTAAVLPGDLAP